MIEGLSHRYTHIGVSFQFASFFSRPNYEILRELWWQGRLVDDVAATWLAHSQRNYKSEPIERSLQPWLQTLVHHILNADN